MNLLIFIIHVFLFFSIIEIMLIILLYFNIIKEFMSYLKLQLFILKAISIYGAGPLPLKSALNAILEFAVV
mgnify:CR=1 FL=1|jgi:hypothetical protein